MHKKLANPQNICKSTKKYADCHVGIVVVEKNLQMHKIFANRQILRFLTKNLQIRKKTYMRQHHPLAHFSSFRAHKS
jgi:hypothetical protein